MAKVIWRNGLTGGSDALDGIAPDDLHEGAATLYAMVSDGTTFYVYVYDPASAEIEDSPNVIKPDAGGSGAWLLLDLKARRLSLEDLGFQVGTVIPSVDDPDWISYSAWAAGINGFCFFLDISDEVP